MGHPVIFSALWPKNQAVCAHLAASFGWDIAAQRNTLAPVVRDAILGAGRRCLSLEEGELAFDSQAVFRDAQERFDRLIGPLNAHITTAIGAQRGEKLTAAFVKTIGQKLHPAMLLVRTMDQLAQNETVRAVVLNESEMVSGKTIALWAQARGIPVFVLSHGVGVGEAYTATRDFVADYLLFVGERGTEPYVDAGFPRERMIVCGNPAWDGVPQTLSRKHDTRTRTYGAIGLDPALPMVVFGTTWNAKLTALMDSDIYALTLRAFLSACAIMRSSGVQFHAVVKDRPPNAEFGASTTRRLAQECGLEAVHYATGDMFEMLMSADVFVGYDTSSFVEAAMAGVAPINVWSPTTFLIGPSIDRNDQIPTIQGSAPDALAQVITLLLRDENIRAELNRAMTEKIKRFALAVDGQSAARCASAISSRLGASEPQTVV